MSMIICGLLAMVIFRSVGGHRGAAAALVFIVAWTFFVDGLKGKRK